MVGTLHPCFNILIYSRAGMGHLDPWCICHPTKLSVVEDLATEINQTVHPHTLARVFSTSFPCRIRVQLPNSQTS